MAGTHFPTKLSQMRKRGRGLDQDGVTVKICCRVCGYEGVQPHPDLKNGAWRGVIA